MSAAIVGQGGRVQQEQGVMCLALNLAKMVKRRFSRVANQELPQLIKHHYAELWEEQKPGLDCSGHMHWQAVRKRHQAMVY